MTKREAVQYYKSNLLPFVRRRHNGKVDSRVLDSTWMVYKDRLLEAGRITQKQLDDWVNPFEGDCK